MATLVNETTRCQLQAIRAQLETEGWIDKRTALELCDCDRLASRIHDLRSDPIDPMNIETVYLTKVNRFGHNVRYAQYRLKREDKDGIS